MKSIINFYQGLDALNLILFWGIIIVIILLLIFSIILVNKNKKLKDMLTSNNYNHEDDLFDKEADDIPVITAHETNLTAKEKIKEQTEEITISPTETEETFDKEIIIENDLTLPEEKKFVAEEHVMEYKPELFNLPNIEKYNQEKEKNEEENKKDEITNAPYQRNVLRERYSNQTSPIGIVKREDNYQKNLNNAKELNGALNEEKTKTTTPKKYLEEVSQKLSEATDLNDIDRTAYELQQEEEAIISYRELMDKKDQIKIVDEEDAVISIDELMNRKKQEERLYNITKEEENNTFINELKHFRNDL